MTVHVFHPKVQVMVAFRRVLCCFLLAENAGLRQGLKILEGTNPYTQNAMHFLFTRYNFLHKLWSQLSI